jgi:ketosteroid isomerase-like protein
MFMRKIVAVVVVLALGALVLAVESGSTVANQEAIEKAVVEANGRIIQASNSLDADKFFGFILDSDKGAIIQDGQLFKTRAEALEVVRMGFQATARMDRRFNQTYVTVLSPTTALLTGTGSYTATLQDGGTASGTFAASLVFVLKDGQWKILHGHYSTPKQ